MNDVLTVRRRRLLRAMGIDVFVRRSAADDPTAAQPAVEPVAVAAPAGPVPTSVPARRAESIAGKPAPTASAGKPAPTPSAGKPAPTASAGEPAPTAAVEWDLVALTGKAGVVVGTVASTEERRLAHGIYVALGGGGAEPTQARFVWPPEGLADRDPRAAATALAAFLRGQVERAGATCLVLLGEALAGLDVSVAVPVVRGPAARALIGDAQAKRSLWRRIATARR